MHSVAIAGHVCVDIIPDLDASTRLEPGALIEVGSVRMTLGGCIANTGGDLADLGLPVRIDTLVGDDVLGEFAATTLAARAGITGEARVVPGASTSYSLVLEPGGADRTIWHHVGANRDFDGRDLPVEGIDLLHLGYPSLLPGLLTNHGAPLREALATARASATTTSVDLAVVDVESAGGALDWARILRGMVAETDVISPSLDDLTSALGITEPPSDALVERLADTLIEWGAAVVMISSGARGLHLRTASAARLRLAGRALSADAERWCELRVHRAPQRSSAPSTTNGAGDAATAGLLFAIAAGAGPTAAVDLALACSAVVIAGRRTTPDAIAEFAPGIAELVVTPNGAVPV